MNDFTPGAVHGPALRAVADLHIGAIDRMRTLDRDRAAAEQRQRADTSRRIAESLGQPDRGGL